MPYAEAIARYGADKPDLRFGLEIQDFGALFGESPFGIFREAIAHGGTVRGFVIPGAAKFSRRELDELAEQAKQFGAAVSCGHVTPPRACSRRRRRSAKQGSEPSSKQRQPRPTTCSSWRRAPATTISKILGQLRLHVAKKQNLIPDSRWELLWVTDFPSVRLECGRAALGFGQPSVYGAARGGSRSPGIGTWDRPRQSLRRDSQRLGVGRRQHPYSRSRDAGQGLSIARHVRRGSTRSIRVLSGGARVRHAPARRAGARLDRICALLAGESSIREVIAFPKTTAAVDLMADAPSKVDPRQLRELRIRTLS